jgi:hypothetical protein
MLSESRRTAKKLASGPGRIGDGFRPATGARFVSVEVFRVRVGTMALLHTLSQGKIQAVEASCRQESIMVRMIAYLPSQQRTLTGDSLSRLEYTKTDCHRREKNNPA